MEMRVLMVLSALAALVAGLVYLLGGVLFCRIMTTGNGCSGTPFAAIWRFLEWGSMGRPWIGLLVVLVFMAGFVAVRYLGG